MLGTDRSETKPNPPKHIAIIMDGNGRWALKRGKTRTFGHKSAIQAIQSSLEFCCENGIKYLSLFAFSTENWKRPSYEINVLMVLMRMNLLNKSNELINKGIKVKVIGDLLKIDKTLLKLINDLQNKTKANNRLTLFLAISYGAKHEITNAAKKIAKLSKQGLLDPDKLDENIFSKFLYTSDSPDVDLLIRTSGEQRISNFLLWQIAYAELYFSNCLWPDFNKEEFSKALNFYYSRERRFGKII